MGVHAVAVVAVTLVLGLLWTDAAIADAVYPTVMPLPQTFTQTPSGALVQVTNPASVPMTFTPTAQGGAVSEAALLLLRNGGRRAMLGCMAGIEDDTLPWLKVRLPPLVNSSNPADAFPTATGFLSAINVAVGDIGQEPNPAELYGIDESYTLDAAAPTHVGGGATVAITAPSYVGALHATQVLSQLIVWDGATWVMPNLPIHITDAPRFKWRGLLLDTARHYLPVDTIRHVIDGLAMHRMNVLHWHIVDAQSFPFESTTYPELSKQGAFHPSLVYTHKDVTKLVDYALARGVRIVPEFDMPGHDASWGFGYPFLTTPCWSYVAGNSGGVIERSINVVSMNPILNETIAFVDGLLKEVAQLFPDPFIHLGGDEVAPGCWNSDPDITAFMAAHGINSAQELQAWFTKKVLPIVKKYGRRPVYWQEAFESNATKGDADAVINVWINLDDLPAIAEAGQDALVSYGAYLDRQNPADGTHWMFFDTWTDMYSKMMPASMHSVLGGEASSWGENCDAANVDERVFHRLPPIAERLWSAATVTSLFDARNRMAELRCKLLRRGIMAGPTYPDYCDADLDSDDGDDDDDDDAEEGVLIALVVVLGVATVAVSAALVITCRKLRAASSPRRDSRLLAESDTTTVAGGASGSATLATPSYAAAGEGGGIAKDSPGSRA